jgi:phage-related protein
MYIRILITVITIVTAFYFIIFKDYKIPIMCYGCESPEGLSKILFKCVVDTSKDSSLCKTATEINNLNNTKEKSKEITKSVFLELTKGIPDTIKKDLEVIFKKISEFTKNVLSIINNLTGNFFKFLKDTFSKIKEVVIQTATEFYNYILKPILDFFINEIIKPFKELASQLINHFKKIGESIKQAIQQFTGFVIDIGKFIMGTIEKIPIEIRKFMNTITNEMKKIINPVINFVRSLNIPIIIEEVVNFVRKIMNDIVNGINEYLVEPVKEVVSDKLEQASYFIKDKYQEIKIQVDNFLSILMIPIQEAVNFILFAGSAIVSSIIYFINEILHFDKIVVIIKDSIKTAKLTIGIIIDVIKEKILDPILDAFNSLKYLVSNFLRTVVGNIKRMFKTIINNVRLIFVKISEYLYKIGNFIFKNVSYISYHYIAGIVNKIIPFDIPTTIKINLFIFMFLGIFLLQFRSFFSNLEDNVILLLITLAIFTPMYFGFKSREIINLVNDELSKKT